jgi:uncharacterized protein (DUF2141 family)
MPLFTLFFCALSAVASNSYPTGARLTIAVQSLRSDGGIVRAAIYGSPAGFPLSKKKAARIVDAPIHDGVAEVQFPDLAPGDYAVVIYHDENSNGKLDQNLVGMPTEGYGFSNNVKPKMAIPSFDSARFHVGAPATAISVSMRY